MPLVRVRNGVNVQKMQSSGEINTKDSGKERLQNREQSGNQSRQELPLQEVPQRGLSETKTEERAACASQCHNITCHEDWIMSFKVIQQQLETIQKNIEHVKKQLESQGYAIITEYDNTAES